jgi:hypothetical protein
VFFQVGVQDVVHDGFQVYLNIDVGAFNTILHRVARFVVFSGGIRGLSIHYNKLLCN